MRAVSRAVLLMLLVVLVTTSPAGAATTVFFVGDAVSVPFGDSHCGQRPIKSARC